MIVAAGCVGDGGVTAVAEPGFPAWCPCPAVRGRMEGDGA